MVGRPAIFAPGHVPFTEPEIELIFRLIAHRCLQSLEFAYNLSCSIYIYSTLGNCFRRLMSDEQRKIYQTDGDRYEALVSREDHQGNILKALEEIVNPDGLDVLDLGAGTGRLAIMLAPRAKSMRAFDVSEEMLRVCRQRLEASGSTNWGVETADHRSIPMEDHSVDLVVSGWSVSYLAVWNPDSWRTELEKWLGEMNRVLRP